MAMKTMTFAAAVQEAVLQEMNRDENVIICGTDVRNGGAYGEFKGIPEILPDRVFNMPISETAISGIGIGGGMVGLRPICSYMQNDFMPVAGDEIINQMAKFCYMFGGKAKIPVVLSGIAGATRSAAAQHSQTMEGVFQNVPGLKIVMASAPADGKGLMAAAIRDNNPVVFLLPTTSMVLKGEVPEGEYVVPLGSADVKKEGTDVTIISYGPIMNSAVLPAAKALDGAGISVEVVDLRTVIPWDRETVMKSVCKTRRALVVHEAPLEGGFGNTIAAEIEETIFDELDGPVMRLGGANCPVPYSPVLEAAYKVTADKIIAKVQSMF